MNPPSPLNLTLISVFLSFLMLTLPVASASSVHIFVNGQEQGRPVQVSPQNPVSRTITISHDPADITWSRVRVKIDVVSGDPGATPTRILLFKCHKDGPAECVRTTPLSFDRYIDGDLAWSDVSEREGASQYPQTANFLTLVRLEDGRNVRWLGLWDTVTRTSYNTFNTFNTEVADVDLEAKSLDLVAPIRSYLQSRQQIPLNWVMKATFRDTTQLVTLAGDAADFGSGRAGIQAARLTTNTVSSSSKDYLLTLGQTSSGIANPLTLHRNPSFTTGDSICDSELGESQATSCSDCGCPATTYCDVANAPAGAPAPAGASAGTCRPTTDISLSTGEKRTLALVDCTQPFRLNVTATVNNAPASLPLTTNGIVTIAGTQYPSACVLTGSTYTCPVSLRPPAACGQATSTLSNNSIALTLSYNDGRQRVFRSLSALVPDVDVQYACACTQGNYCDVSRKACSLESSISLSVLSVTSYLSNFRSGDPVTIVARVNNPPSDLNVEKVTTTFGNITITGGSSSAGYSSTATCVADTQDRARFSCSFPLTIADYDHAKQYVVRANSIAFSVRYSDSTRAVTRDLTSAFSDITIPSYRCGDGIANPEETEATCCSDVACMTAGMYCDAVRACQFVGSVRLSVESVTPTNLTDCTVEHPVDIAVQVANAPTGLSLSRATLTSAGELKAWPLACSNTSAFGLFNCVLRVPPQTCQPINVSPFTRIGPNQLSFALTWPNGNKAPITSTLTDAMPDLTLTPAYHPGDGVCETAAGESAANSCVDCPCKDDPAFGADAFCNYDPAVSLAGSCQSKSAMKLKLLKPTNPVRLTTCEQDNDVNIQVEVENAPARLQLTGQQAVLKNEASDLFFCEPQEYPGKPIGSFYNCTLTIPAVYTCEQGKTIKYPADGNSIALTFQFPNGPKRFETTTLNSSLPEITITQKFRSLYDITQDGMKQIKAKLRETMKLGRDLLKWQKTCLDMALVIFAVSAVAMITVPIAASSSGGSAGGAAAGTAGGALVGGALGGPVGAVILGGFGGLAFGNVLDGGGQKWQPYKTETPTEDLKNYNPVKDQKTGETLWYPKNIDQVEGNAAFKQLPDGSLQKAQASTASTTNWAQAAQATAQIAGAVMQMWQAFCQMISNQYQANIQVQQMEVQFVQMEMCMDIAQHQMDVGNCNRPGQAQGCFNTMVSCIDFGKIQNNLNQLNQYQQQNANLIGQAANSLTAIGDALQVFAPPEGGDTSLTVYCGGSAKDGCCGYTRQTAGTTVTTNQGTYSNLQSVTLPTKISVQALDPTGSCRGQGKQVWYSLNGAPQVRGIQNQDATTVFSSTGDQVFAIYCGEPGIISKSRQIGTYTFHYCQGNPDQGCYETNGEPLPECAVLKKSQAAATAPLGTTALTADERISGALLSVKSARAKMGTPPAAEFSQGSPPIFSSVANAEKELTEAQAALQGTAQDKIAVSTKSLNSAKTHLVDAHSKLAALTPTSITISILNEVDKALDLTSQALQNVKGFDFSLSYAPQPATINQPVAITISSIKEGTGPYQVRLDCGGGIPPISESAPTLQHTLTGRCTYPTDSSYTAQVTVTDKNGIALTKPLPITVGIGANEINLEFTKQPRETVITNQPIDFTVAATGGVGAPGEQRKYALAIDCGQNALAGATGQRTEARPPTTSSTAAFTCKFPAKGRYTVTATVQDSSGKTDAAHKKSISSPPIEATDSIAFRGTGTTPFLEIRPRTPNGLIQTLTVRFYPSGKTPYKLTANFGDGKPVATATSSITAADTLEAEHEFDLEGDYNGWVQIEDTSGNPPVRENVLFSAKSAPPTVSLINPAVSSFTAKKGANVPVSGSVSDPNTLKDVSGRLVNIYLCDSAGAQCTPGTIATVSTSGTFSGPLKLDVDPGTYTLHTKVTDRSNKEADNSGYSITVTA